jgi:tripartite-type tricarboxylate transporter receptor subunit TctC
MKPLVTLARALCVLALLTLAVSALPAAAQNYPTRPIKIIVPFGAGGVADITARVLARKMSETPTRGQQVIGENRPGAGGIVASDAVAKADPDGYTLLLVSNGNAVSATLFKSLPYDTVNDFAPVSTAGFFDLVLLVNGDSRIGTVAELIASAKANPTKFNIATINVGSTQNLSAELFRSMAGVEAPVVPFKGTPAVVTALRGNEVQAAFEILAPVMSQIKAGTLKAIAVTSNRRFAGLPNVPTVSEAGVSGYQSSSWNGISAPAKTPRPIIDRLNREINAAVSSPDVKQRLRELGVEARGSTPEGLKELLVAEIAKWRAVIERARIPKQ